jgi:hypothetical protein
VHRAASGNVLPVLADSYLAVAADADVDVPAPRIGLDDVKALADFIVSDGGLTVSSAPAGMALTANC